MAHHPDAKNFLINGYWVINEETNRPYKTATQSLSVIRERMESGMIFASRKEANAFIRDPAKWAEQFKSNGRNR